MSSTLSPAFATRPEEGVGAVDISVVMPCLNEEASVGGCVRSALEGIHRTGMRGEVIVSDNGSTDRSVALAEAAGARVVHQALRGYGNAYLKGFASARGRILVMGDSDGSYDFSQLDHLVERLDQGADLVLGSRFAGEILEGAMPWSHRYIGNPVLTRILNQLFGLKTSDAHSGMRAFTRNAYERMALRCGGMEFASELVVKAARAGLDTAEVPIIYHPRTGESKLHSMRDGWRHLRFLLLLSPVHLFAFPGLCMFVVGLVGQTALLSGPLPLGFHDLDVHFSILTALLTLLGFQTLIFGMFARAWAERIGLQGPSRLATFVQHELSLERGLIVGAAFFAFGLIVDVAVLAKWLGNSMGPLDAIRPAVYAMTFMMLGTQIALASFFLSLFRMQVHAGQGVVDSEVGAGI